MIRTDIENAPKDRFILLKASWSWNGSHDAEGPASWRVVSWVIDGDVNEDDCTSGGFWTETANPYLDLAVNPVAWAELPEIIMLDTDEDDA